MTLKLLACCPCLTKKGLRRMMPAQVLDVRHLDEALERSDRAQRRRGAGCQLQEDACSSMLNLALQQCVHVAHDSLRRRFVPDPNSPATPLVPPVGGSSRWSRPRMLSADACISQVKPPSACAVQTALSRRPLGRLTPLEDWSAEETCRASNPESREGHSAADLRGTRILPDFPSYMREKSSVAGKEITTPYLSRSG